MSDEALHLHFTFGALQVASLGCELTATGDFSLSSSSGATKFRTLHHNTYLKNLSTRTCFDDFTYD